MVLGCCCEGECAAAVGTSGGVTGVPEGPPGRMPDAPAGAGRAGAEGGNKPPGRERPKASAIICSTSPFCWSVRDPSRPSPPTAGCTAAAGTAGAGGVRAADAMTAWGVRSDMPGAGALVSWIEVEGCRRGSSELVLVGRAVLAAATGCICAGEAVDAGWGRKVVACPAGAEGRLMLGSRGWPKAAAAAADASGGKRGASGRLEAGTCLCAVGICAGSWLEAGDGRMGACYHTHE